MQLRRTTPNAFDKSLVALLRDSHDFRADEEWDNNVLIGKRVTVHFPRFGEGQYRQSDFEVCADWEDAQRMIDIFCENGQPEAIAIRDAVRLAAVVQKAGWQPPKSAPQSN